MEGALTTLWLSIGSSSSTDTCLNAGAGEAGGEPRGAPILWADPPAARFFAVFFLGGMGGGMSLDEGDVEIVDDGCGWWKWVDERDVENVLAGPQIQTT